MAVFVAGYFVIEGGRLAGNKRFIYPISFRRQRLAKFLKNNSDHPANRVFKPPKFRCRFLDLRKFEQLKFGSKLLKFP